MPSIGNRKEKQMTIDKYTKFILTLIAVGVIGINFHLFNGSVVKDALAATTNDWQVEYDGKYFIVFRNNGSSYCKSKSFPIAQWRESGC